MTLTELASWAFAVGLLALVWRWRIVNVPPRRDTPARELDERFAARRRHPSTAARPARHVRRIERPALYDWNDE